MSHLRLLSFAAFALLLSLAPVAQAAAGRAQFNLYFQSTLASASYQQKVFQRFTRGWKQPGRKHLPQPGKRTIVQAHIGADGKLVSAVVSLESGSKAWDEAALAAVRKAAPFEPLPAGSTTPTLEVHFHVAWVADGAGVGR